MWVLNLALSTGKSGVESDKDSKVESAAVAGLRKQNTTDWSSSHCRKDRLPVLKTRSPRSRSKQGGSL